MILTDKEIETLSSRNDARLNAFTDPPLAYHTDIPSLIASHREAATQLAAATKRADDAEKQRDAALAVLREVDGKSRVCLSCGTRTNTHTPDCALAACLNGGA